MKIDPFVLDCVRTQVEAILSEITRIEGSEFPYEHTKDALQEARAIFESHGISIASITEASDPDTVEFVCSAAYNDLRNSVELLGFLLRSTNIRNAFEAYGPMLRLARKLLGPQTKLILSSEWLFSPFTYIGYNYLPGYVLIGLPAPESSNPFLLPLAGHELGHSAWPGFDMDKLIGTEVQKAILEEIKTNWNDYQKYFGVSKPEEASDLTVRHLRIPARAWAMRQCEEHFCDFIGLRIFGEAYLYAFAYLIAPHRTGSRPLHYPNIRTRAECLAAAATKYGMTVPEGYADMFENLQGPSPMQTRETVLLRLADTARGKFVGLLQDKADDIVTGSGLGKRQPDLVDKCAKRLKLMVPVEGSGGLANLLNAAWQAWLTPSFFHDAEHNKSKEDNLREIVLKSIEILEIEMKRAAVREAKALGNPTITT